MEIIGTLLGMVASILGIFEYIITIKEKINRAIDSLKLPRETDFYFFSFFALVASGLGGLLWNQVCRAFGAECPYVGGSGSEPHGRLAVIWPLISFGVVILTLIIFNLKYRFIEIKEQLLLYFAFLVGTTISSMIFYDLPINGYRGFRNYFEATTETFIWREVSLVLIWSLLISLLGFLMMALVKLKISAKPIHIWMLIRPFLEQIILVTGITTLAVTFCLLTFPNEIRFETARGVIAGLALRVSIFFGLLIAHIPLEGVLPAYLRHLIKARNFFVRQSKHN